MPAQTTTKPEAPAFALSTHYLVAVALSWLFPGAGHWMLGQRTRGVLLGVTLIGTFWVGETVLAENKAVTKEVHPIFFYLQVGNGFSTLMAETLFGEPVHKDANDISTIRYDLPRHLSLGILFCSVSGLLNVLLVLHIMDPRTWTEAATEGDRPTPESGGPGSGASSGGSAP